MLLPEKVLSGGNKVLNVRMQQICSKGREHKCPTAITAPGR